MSYSDELKETLRQGADKWNKLRADHKPYVSPSMGDAWTWHIDLSGADLSGLNLAGADLSSSGLIEINLTAANLRWTRLSRANLSRTNLTRANFAEAYLDFANLSLVNFSDADLTGAYLPGANLHRADLNKANFSEANLKDATLTYANLTDAIFVSAYLKEASFRGSNLTRVDLTSAQLANTTFNDTDLHSAIGLETVYHRGPSFVGVETLYRSAGHVPDEFWRGCGIPEAIVVSARSLAAAQSPIQFCSCFISYSHADKSFASYLHDELQARGVRCWLDEHELKPGDDILDEVDRGIRSSDRVLLCCSKASLMSWWVDSEINSAFAREQALIKVRGKKARILIPLDLDGHLFSDEYVDGKATQIRSRLAADFTGWKRDKRKFEAGLERLIKSLRTDDEG